MYGGAWLSDLATTYVCSLKTIEIRQNITGECNTSYLTLWILKIFWNGLLCHPLPFLNSTSRLLPNQTHKLPQTTCQDLSCFIICGTLEPIDEYVLRRIWANIHSSWIHWCRTVHTSIKVNSCCDSIFKYMGREKQKDMPHGWSFTDCFSYAKVQKVKYRIKEFQTWHLWLLVLLT